ncbi:MAG: hypothetical protein F9K19_06285 [Rhizobiaceae bacterium]|nr:MAG: hypothetical protein F9K19_06285 [Rhizobiaceae bacterium]
MSLIIDADSFGDQYYQLADIERNAFFANRVSDLIRKLRRTNVAIRRHPPNSGQPQWLATALLFSGLDTLSDLVIGFS